MFGDQVTVRVATKRLLGRLGVCRGAGGGSICICVRDGVTLLGGSNYALEGGGGICLGDGDVWWYRVIRLLSGEG